MNGSVIAQLHDARGCCTRDDAWATGAGWPDHKAPKPAGARIQMGEGHFNRDGKPSTTGTMRSPAVCSRCHGANGIPEYLKEGKNTPAPHVKNAFACTNCHADMLSYARHASPR